MTTEMEEAKFKELLGKTLVSCVMKETKDVIEFITTDGWLYWMWHDQSCCESVTIESIVGDLTDLVGNPILVAEESSNEEDEKDLQRWTFYKLATIKGHVDIRWYGESNGCYSVSVDFSKRKL